MPKADKQRRNAKLRAGGRKRIRTGESRLVESLTAAWMLSVLTAFLCELGAGAAWLFGGDKELLRLLSVFLFFAATVIGLVTLALTAAVLRLRKTRPPLGITLFSLSVAAAPIVLIVLAGIFNLRP